jgi:hypothetical protein
MHTARMADLAFGVRESGVLVGLSIPSSGHRFPSAFVRGGGTDTDDHGMPPQSRPQAREIAKAGAMGGCEKVIRSSQTLGFESFGELSLRSFLPASLFVSELDSLSTLWHSRNSQSPGIGLRRVLFAGLLYGVVCFWVWDFGRGSFS